MSPTGIDAKLAPNNYYIDTDFHIRFNRNSSQKCQSHSCLYVCPAGCFKLRDGHITFSYEGCLECGSCRIACEKNAIEWVLPKHGFGICYAYG